MVDEWNKPYTQTEHLIRVNELRLHIKHIRTGAKLFYGNEYGDVQALWVDMQMHNMHLKLAREMQGDGAVFSLNEMEKRRN